MGGAAFARADEQAAVGGDARGAQSQLGPEEGRVARAEELGRERDLHDLVGPDVVRRCGGQRDAQRGVIEAHEAERRPQHVVPPRVVVDGVVGAEGEVARRRRVPE
eukprot:scaffold86873_cov72-Phaeocystis_antarctica.AAC.2